MMEFFKNIFNLHEKKVCFIGIGGGGSNVVENIAKMENTHTVIHMNSDLQALQQKKYGHRLLLGYEDKHGLGCGAKMECGLQLFNNTTKAKLQETIPEETTPCLVTALGGGVGSGVTPEVVKYLKEIKTKFKVIVIMPFTFEGKKRQQTAMKSLELIKHYTRNVIIIRNDDCLIKGSKQGFSESLATISKQVYGKGV